MPTLDEQFREFAKKYPTPASHPNGPTGNGDTTWDQDCAAFVYRFGMFVIGNQAWQDACEVFGPTAWDVARASGTPNVDASKAPGGAIHWWRSSTLSGKPGHVGVDLTGGGTKLAMATYAADPELAPALGYASVKGYSDAKTAMKYVGWSLNYGGARFPITAQSGGGTAPLTERKPMFSLIKDSGSATIWVASTVTGIRVGLKSVTDYNLLKKFREGIDGDPLNTTGNEPKLSAAQMDVVRGYLQLINLPAGFDLNAVVAALDAADDAEHAAILAAIASNPAAVVEELKKPGN